MKLSPRLQQIASYVSPGASIADIGSDHAYLPIYLVERGLVTKAIASDINEGPVANGRKKVAEYGLSASIEVRCFDGLMGIGKGEVDEIIIAGMGGILISSIIKDRLSLCQEVNRLILQPMTEKEHLRTFLWDHGFEIEDEDLVQEGHKFYEVMVAVYRGGPVERGDPTLGVHLLSENTVVTRNYLEMRIKKLSKIIGNIKANATVETSDKIEELEALLKAYKERLVCLSTEEK